MLSTSLQHTPLAALGRPVAGTIGKTLVVTLPGSVKAVRENIEALQSGGVLEHAVELIRGGSGQNVHAELAAGGHGASQGNLQGQSGSASAHEHHHHHHHHHHDEKTALSHDPSQPGMSSRRDPKYTVR
jgi:gephyrin